MPDPPRTLSLETYTAEELMRTGCLAHNQPVALYFRRDLLDLIEHHAANAFPSKFLLYNNVVDLDCIGSDLHPDDRNELANELPEQTTCRNADGGSLRLKKSTDGLVISGLDRPDEELLTSHDTPALEGIVACFASIEVEQIIS